MTDQGARLREALSSRVLVADGAMGTMLQAHDLTLEDFEGHEGCNEILNVTRPDVVRAVLSTTSPSGSKSSRRPVRVSRGSQQTIGQRRNSHDL